MLMIKASMTLVDVRVTHWVPHLPHSTHHVDDKGQYDTGGGSARDEQHDVDDEDVDDRVHHSRTEVEVADGDTAEREVEML